MGVLLYRFSMFLPGKDTSFAALYNLVEMLVLLFLLKFCDVILVARATVMSTQTESPS